MTREVSTGYRWIVWGVFCSVFRFEFHEFQVLPAWAGYGMAAYGICRIGAALNKRAMRALKPLLLLLVAVSTAGWILTRAGVGQSLPGILSLAVPILEFLCFYGCLDMLKKSGLPVGIFRTGYLVIETAGLLSGLIGTALFLPAALYFMALALIAGKVVFFFCIWGESRKAGV